MKYLITIIFAVTLSLLPAHAADNPQSEMIQSKLDTIALPDLSFEKTPLRSALDKVRLLSAAYDPETDVKKRGVNIILKSGPEATTPVEITTSLKSPALGEAFAEIAKQAKLTVIVESWAVALVPQE